MPLTTSSSMLPSWWSPFIESVSSFFMPVWQWLSSFFSKNPSPTEYESFEENESLTALTIEKSTLLVSENNKFDFIQSLPADLIPYPTRESSVLGDYLTPEDKTNLAATSKPNYGLFHNKPVGERITAKLLLFIAQGEQDKASQILKNCPELLSKRGDVTDYSGRTFHNISAFQYALWALDTFMQRMIIEAIPDSTEGDALRADLIRQYEEVETDGVTYVLEGQSHTNQHHFDLSVLIGALQYYDDHVDGCMSTQPINRAEMERQWCTVVGLAQFYVPAYVAQEHCNPSRSFYPTPKFNKPGLKRSLTFYNCRNHTDMHWWAKAGSSSSVLGVDFGICRGGGARGCGTSGGEPVGAAGRRGAAIDLAAVSALCEVRTADLKPTLEILKRGPGPELGSGCVIS